METIVGIDLGTTNSEISYLKDGKPVIINIDNQPIMPSCVGVDKSGNLLVGMAAKNQAVSDPEATVLSIKRKMGESIKIPLGDKEFSPEEISSFILSELKKQAENHLGIEVKKAVITVPAYFDDAQRKATKDAGALAGLDVARIINEPTAAAVAYDAGHKENHKMLVYDLGGGTFDVSLVVVEDGIVEVKASHGDTHLGGDDFDDLLMNHVAEEFKNKKGTDLSQDVKARSRLRASVEKAKRELSDNPYAKIREEFIFQDHHLDIEIQRLDYEEMIRPLLQKTLDCIHMCLKDASILPRDIDKIILVGGTTRTPLVHEIIQKEFGLEPRYEISPDLIVSMGAAIQGGMIAGHDTHSILVDITPHTFGTSAIDEYQGMMRPDVYIPIINRNTPLPVSKAEVFQTSHDEQEKVEVNIYQGEESLAGDNTFIGNFMVEGLSKVPAGNKMVLNLELDINGILKVTAMEKATGLSKEVIMDTKNVQRSLDLDAAKKNVASMLSMEEDVIDISVGEEKGDLISKAKELRIRAEKLSESLNEEDAKEIHDLLAKSLKAVNEHDWETLSDVNESLEDMIFYLEE